MDEPEDEIRDESLPEPSDLITSEDTVPDDRGEGDDGEEASGLLPSLPGPLIAAFTFVPTFLALFFGLSYLLADATQTARTASAPVPSAAMSDLGAQATPPLSKALRDPFVAPQLSDSPATGPGDPKEEIRPSDPRKAPRASSVETATPPAVEPRTPPPTPTLPPVAISPAPEPRAARSAEPPRQPKAAVLATAPERTPTAEPRRSGRDWTPAAAFAERDAASRLASSIQQQGYPVEIRQEQSSSRPWVVWIGAKPGGERRR
jgi:hypothetical protein